MKRFIYFLPLLTLLTLSGCADSKSHARAVYMLFDTSGTYTQEIAKAQAIINYLLSNLATGDSLAVARIDSGSFSEKDIIAKVTFDQRPSTANEQKRAFRKTIDAFVSDIKPAPYTDITGGTLQAIEFLTETGAGKKYVLIFSDMKEELPKGHVRDFSIPFDGINVVALNVTKLRSDNVDPREYVDRLESWQHRVVKAGGTWRVINDLDRIETILSE